LAVMARPIFSRPPSSWYGWRGARDVWTNYTSYTPEWYGADESRHRELYV